ncbi:uncharacterized protein L201_005268 [Kwoniella dendrophila CBS 6074]|uniref:Methyltransferase type 11 domain-containing protein n=1 Tax=Kwoniella dendrophila CBS 6074 TaxID=1295534 RepID=A0AAX4K0M8_9TREE
MSDPSSKLDAQINIEDEAGPSTTELFDDEPSLSSKIKAPKMKKVKPIKEPKPPKPKQDIKKKPQALPVKPFDKPDEEEEKNVHEVYEAIAGHFSQTRHKPWPFIQKFLHSLPANSIGLDSGAGNGKYLPSSREAGLEMIALDRSSGLLEIAKNENGGECLRGDLCFQGWRKGVFDFAISIAAIHHLSTPERRRLAVKSLIRPLKLSSSPTYSKFMIYVWAYEQGTLSKRRMGTLTNSSPNSTPSVPNTSHPATSPPPITESNNQSILNQQMTDPNESAKEETNTETGVKEIEEKIQDLLVPWVYSKPPPGPTLRSKNTPIPSDSNPNPDSTETTQQQQQQQQEEQPEPKVYHRYYHLFIEGELKELVKQAAKEDDYLILPDGTNADNLETTLKEHRGESSNDSNGEQKKWLRVRGVGWEADNWWIEGEVGRL